jgi:hypothetical protein
MPVSVSTIFDLDASHRRLLPRVRSADEPD